MKADVMAAASPAYDIDAIRRDFPILSKEVYGKPLVYLDNGASAQKPRAMLDAIRELLALGDDPGRPCAEVDRIAQRQLGEVGRRIARLEALRRELGRMLDECGGGRAAECRVLEVLRDHSECLTDHERIGA